MGWIYKITSPSGKCYVGQTIQKPEQRWKDHKKPGSHCTLLKRALDRYKDQMKFEVVEEVPEDQMDDRETYWIEELKCLAPTGYNCKSGGDGKQRLSETTKSNMVEAGRTKAIRINGRLGWVRESKPNKSGTTWYTSYTTINKKSVRLSYSRCNRDEAEEVLKEYTRDPDNFKFCEPTRRPNGSGSIREVPNGRFQVNLGKKYLGTFNTREEAEKALAETLNECTLT